VASRRPAVLLVCLFLPLAVSLSGRAVEGLDLALARLEGAGWSVRTLRVRLEWLDESRAALRLTAESATLPEPLGRLSGLRLACDRAAITARQIRCREGRLQFNSGTTGPQHIHLGFDYRFDSQRLVVDLEGIRFEGGRISARMVYGQGGWELTARGTALPLDAITTRLVAAGLLPVAVEGSGGFGFTARLQGKGSEVQTGHVNAGLHSESFSDEAGNLAGEGLALSLDADLERRARHWEIGVTVSGEQGQLYVNPVYLDFGAAPMQAAARFDWLPQEETLHIHSFDLRQPDTLRLHARGTLHPGRPEPLERLSLEVEQGSLPGLYDTWLKPWLTGTLLGDLQTGGQLGAQLQLAHGELQVAHLQLDGVALDDRESRFGLHGLAGEVDWARDEVPRQSALRWEEGHLFRVPLGAARIATTSTGSTLQLQEPARIGIVDGELQLDTFEVGYPEGVIERLRVDGILTPVSMRALTRSLGWPEFAGKLSGVIPDVRYENGNLVVGGMLLVRVFDGDITLSNLRLARPFSVIPRLWVDARVNNIDLEALTGTFAFGKIEGRLDGRVDGLYMESWRPVAFDAEFATPPDDHSRHRISQKAVDNISSIGGGGVGGALSRSFLRFFEDFPYERLGLRCRLQNGICDMGGVAPAANGYYIVKGRLLPPRLDVIGYADRVDWDSLVSQLVAVTERQGSTIP
jgi:hypothetical protein